MRISDWSSDVCSSDLYLEDLPSMEMVAVYEGLISASTNDGEDVGHRLIDASINSYELKASSFLSEESDRSKGLFEKAKTAADRHVSEKQVRTSYNERHRSKERR